MNTGIQDAHNLAWKITSVIKGIAPTSMLNTYDMERRPVMLLSSIALFKFIFILKCDKPIDVYCCQISVFNTRLSLENYRAAMSVPATLGLDPTVANTGTQ